MFPLPLRKKKEELTKIYIPVDMVLSYAAQGLSEPEIIAKLQAQGFEPEHIDKALRIALKERITSPSQTREEAPTFGAESMHTPPSLPHPPGPPLVGLEELPQQIDRNPAPLGYPPERVVSPTEPRQVSVESAEHYTFEPQPVEMPDISPEEITVEELIEGIVAERWKEFEERLSDFEKRDLQLQSEIDDLRKRVVELEKSLETREQGFSSKLDDFGGSVENIEGRIGSIEKVFKEFLPELTSNIKTMSDLVEKIKEEKK